jgi:hypothetical protein
MVIGQLLESIVRLPGEFAAVAMHDPLSALLMAIGAIFVALPVGYVGLLVLGAIAELFSPASGGQPQQPGQ